MKRNEKRLVCANCSFIVKDGDKYCRQCGTEIGKGAYLPIDDLMQCIYGPPPVDRMHTCEQCGYSWYTYLMIDHEKNCPKCGGRAPYIENCSED